MNQLRRLLACTLFAQALAVFSGGATIYHVDSRNGDDARSGTSPELAVVAGL